MAVSTNSSENVWIHRRSTYETGKKKDGASQPIGGAVVEQPTRGCQCILRSSTRSVAYNTRSTAPTKLGGVRRLVSASVGEEVRFSMDLWLVTPAFHWVALDLSETSSLLLWAATLVCTLLRVRSPSFIEIPIRGVLPPALLRETHGSGATSLYELVLGWGTYLGWYSHRLLSLALLVSRVFQTPLFSVGRGNPLYWTRFITA